MITWYKDDKLKILFDKEPDTDTKKIIPNMTEEEIEKIREFVFPESKILKPIQAPSEDEEEYEEQSDDSDFVTDDEGEEEDELDDEEDI